MATYFSSHKPSEQDMLGTAGEVRINSQVTPWSKTYIHQVCGTLNVIKKACQGQWQIGMNGKRGPKGIHAVGMPWWYNHKLWHINRLFKPEEKSQQN